MIAGGDGSSDDSSGGGDSSGGDSSGDDSSGDDRKGSGGSGSALSCCPTCGKLPDLAFVTQALLPSTVQAQTELTAAFNTLFRAPPDGRIHTVPGQYDMMVPRSPLPADVICFGVRDRNFFVVYMNNEVPYQRVVDVLTLIVMCTRPHPLTTMAISTRCRGKCTLACNVEQSAADFVAMCALIMARLMAPQQEEEEEEEEEDNTAYAMRLVVDTLNSPPYSSLWFREGEGEDGNWDPDWEPDDDEDDDDEDEDM